jgi:hypothetical protein
MELTNSISDFFVKKYLINKLQYLQVNPNLEKAIEFYQTHVLDCNTELEPLLDTYQFPSRLPFWKWELFAAILVGDVCRSYTNEGADLTKHEVKSRLNNQSFEYQYHKNSWREKLAKEPLIRHIYISYWPGFRNLDVRIVDGRDLAHHFASWELGLIEAYESGPAKQRFRKRIPFKEVVEKGSLFLRIRNGNPISRDSLLV